MFAADCIHLYSVCQLTFVYTVLQLHCVQEKNTPFCSVAYIKKYIALSATFAERAKQFITDPSKTGQSCSLEVAH